MTRRFTTADLEALLGGVRSLPWSVGYEADDAEWVIHAAHPNLPIPLDAGTAYTAANANIMAAAPEVVAELITARRGLHALVDWCETKAMKARTYPGPAHRKEQMERGAAVYDELAHRLRDILKGDTDE